MTSIDDVFNWRLIPSESGELNSKRHANQNSREGQSAPAPITERAPQSHGRNTGYRDGRVAFGFRQPVSANPRFAGTKFGSRLVFT